MVSGDGSEDISCALSKTNLEVPVQTDGSFTLQETREFFTSLRIHFISFLVFPWTFCETASFLINLANVPPIVQPLVAGSVLYNTELKKDSGVLKNIDSLYGNQMKLCEMLLSGELILANFDNLSNVELVELCRKLEFQDWKRSTIIIKDKL